jgi:hypothetical protein
LGENCPESEKISACSDPFERSVRLNICIFIARLDLIYTGTQNAYCFIFTYEGLEFKADKRIEQNNKTIASADCHGIPAANQGSGE